MQVIAFLKNSLLIICILILTSCRDKASFQRLPYYNTPDFSPSWQASDSLHRISSFSFIDQNNQPVTESTFLHKIYVANFFFTRCTAICPVITRNLLKVQDAFNGEENLAFISHSVTPWLDSVEQLKKYAQEYKLDKRWHLVTGNQASVYKIARQSYYAEEELGYARDSSEFIHSEHILLIDTKRHIRGIYNGTLELEMDNLIADINTLMKEEYQVK